MTETQQWLTKWFERRGQKLQWEHAAALDVVKDGLLDSFALVELIDDIESQLNLRFTEADLSDGRMATLGGLAELVQTKRA